MRTFTLKMMAAFRRSTAVRNDDAVSRFQGYSTTDIAGENSIAKGAVRNDDAVETYSTADVVEETSTADY